MVNIQWYPGHMEKARRDMLDGLKAVDFLIEVRDARIPNASANPILNDMAKGKERLVILSKSDLADPEATSAWQKALEAQGYHVLALNLQDTKSRKALIDTCKELTQEKRNKMIAKGIKPRAMRAMACGIPNSGKSTLINLVSKKKSAKTADKPGVTRGLTWIHADETLDILDTPGVLWPKFEDPTVGVLLGATGAINDNILDLKEIAIKTIEIILKQYETIFIDVFGISKESKKEDYLLQIAKARHLEKENAEADVDRAASLFLHELRKGKYGRITLESAQ
ncbi:MAG: ribosome biogenesis GTPase YlqF [Solobacterium sp.]|nr:ribosome biogenesis GTPase YlqF [Solobacterium sp.]